MWPFPDFGDRTCRRYNSLVNSECTDGADQLKILLKIDIVGADHISNFN